MFEGTQISRFILMCWQKDRPATAFGCSLTKKFGVHDDKWCVIYLGSIPWRARNLSHLQSAQTGSMAHPMSTGESFPGGESAGI